MFSKEGKLFGKVSIIDLFVLAVIVAIVLFGVFRLGNEDGIGILQSPQSVTLGLTQEDLSDFTANALRIGDPVAANDFNVELGHIVALSQEVAVESHPNADGILVVSPMEGFSRVEITTELYGFPFANGIWVMGHRFLVGEELVIRAGDVNMFMTVSAITVN